MAIKGNCFMCGKDAGKTAMKNHIMKTHNEGDENCFLIKAEGAYDKDYWLFFTMPTDATLSAVDDFLREIWCECCGHLSAFRSNGRQVGKSKKLSTFDKGDTLLYEYDFGSTTEILLTVVDELSRPKQREKVLLLARNEPHNESCDGCGTPAEYFNAWEGGCFCEKCADESEDNEAFLPIVNSPRCGVCGYDGELDRWVFDPNGPFPQLCAEASGTTHLQIARNKAETEKSPEEKWGSISGEFQQKILENIWCVKCGVTTMKDYTMENEQPDIVLTGKCVKCGGEVARLVEFD